MLAVFSTFMSISFQSCTTEELVGDLSGKNELDSPLFGKWTVGNQDAEYGSFEFTADKKYIITQRTTTPSPRSASLRASETVYVVIIFGDIASLSSSGNEYTLNLSEFGTITITIDPAKGTATVTVNGETYTAAKEKEIEGADSTTLDLLCHTWNFEANAGAGDDESSGRFTFTKSGTYLASGVELSTGEEFHEQNTFKLLSSTEIQLASRAVSISNSNCEITIEEREETTDFTIKKLTESECILYREEEENGFISKITINMTR
jgi:hypothetical protein